MYAVPPRSRPPRRITGLGDLTLTILDRPAGFWPRRRTMTFRATLLYDDGSTKEVAGMLDGLLDFATRTRLTAALDAVRDRVAERLVPGGRISGGGTPGGGMPGGRTPSAAGRRILSRRR